MDNPNYPTIDEIQSLVFSLGGMVWKINKNSKKFIADLSWAKHGEYTVLVTSIKSLIRALNKFLKEIEKEEGNYHDYFTDDIT